MTINKPTILPKQMMRYEGMTLAQLHSLILLCGEESTVALWYLLSVRLDENLQMCYLQLSKDFTNDFKTYEDYRLDFYIYLYVGHPDYVTGPTQFHYLQTITDNTKIASWMQQSFRQFINNERRALVKLNEALPAYLQEQKYEHLTEPQIELTRIAVSLAWYNQFGSVEDRYLFFRSMKKKVVKSFNRDEELNDEETAQALGMKYTTFRSRVSRCCKEVQQRMVEMKHADIALLDANSLLLVDRICNIDEHTLDAIVDSLVTDAERQLPQYDDILEARLRKEEEHVSFYRMEEIPEMFEFKLGRMAEGTPEREFAGDMASPSSSSPLESVFEKILKPSKKGSYASAERPQPRKKTFVETFVENFKSFLSV